MKIIIVVGKTGRLGLQLLRCALVGWSLRPADRPSMDWLTAADVLSATLRACFFVQPGLRTAASGRTDQPRGS
jgi:dTDP-4-dehydrorhamnose reductase